MLKLISAKQIQQATKMLKFVPANNSSLKVILQFVRLLVNYLAYEWVNVKLPSKHCLILT